MWNLSPNTNKTNKWFQKDLEKKVTLSIHWCLSAITQALSSETLPTDWSHNARIAFHLQHSPSRAIHLWTDLQFLCASCMPCWWHPDLLSHEETRLNTETPPPHALEGLSHKQGISKTGELPNQKERFRSSWLVSIPIFGSKQQITSKEFCPDRPTNLKMVWVYPTQPDHSPARSRPGSSTSESRPLYCWILTVAILGTKHLALQIQGSH
jgi:hypothetical protein